MTYTPQTWTNDVSPLNADRMNYIESGIEDAHAIVPPGAMMEYAGAAAPTGWLLADGASYLRDDYTALFTAIGGTGSPWGLPDGTHFNVPDLRGRVPVGLGTNTDVDTLAENDGAAVGSRRPKHSHTVNDSEHSHTVPQAEDGVATGGGTDFGFTGLTSTSSDPTGITVGPQTNSPTDGPAYVVVNYIIKT